MDCSPPDSSVHGHSLGKNIGVGCLAFLQGIFLTQELNPCLLCLLHWQRPTELKDTALRQLEHTVYFMRSRHWSTKEATGSPWGGSYTRRKCQESGPLAPRGQELSLDNQVTVSSWHILLWKNPLLLRSPLFVPCSGNTQASTQACFAQEALSPSPAPSPLGVRMCFVL